MHDPFRIPVPCLQGFADAKTVKTFVDKIIAAGNPNATLYTYPGEGEHEGRPDTDLNRRYD